MSLPTPHLDKLNAAILNDKMPQSEIPRLKSASERYKKWIEDMNQVSGDRDTIASSLVSLFNDYKFYIDFDLIYCSQDDFLYRQKGQLKIDNSVIEEFLPHLVYKCFPRLQTSLNFGPTKCFSNAYFQSTLQHQTNGGGLSIRTKDQDFAISKKIYIKSSHTDSFQIFDLVEAYLGYVTAECKTNLDKTMFQEATATAHDVKSAVPGSKYFLLCEWLDMTPVSTAPTDIDEVLVMRKAKRISSNIRSAFSTYTGRMQKRDWYHNFLLNNPFAYDVFSRFIGHIESLINNDDPLEADVLEDGFF
jgi:hypothetical protein